MPVALIVSQGRDQKGDKIRVVFSWRVVVVAAPSSVVTSPSPVRSELDWRRPSLRQGTVEIDGVTYHVKLLKDSRTAVAVQECDWEASCLRSTCVVPGNWRHEDLGYGGD